MQVIEGKLINISSKKLQCVLSMHVNENVVFLTYMCVKAFTNVTV